MRRQDMRPEDQRLQDLFHELRREEERGTPPFRPLRLRKGFGERSTRVRRLAVAGSLAVAVTAVLAAIALAPRFVDSRTTQANSPGVRLVTANKYVPPPPRSESPAVEPVAEEPRTIERVIEEPRAKDPAPTSSACAESALKEPAAEHRPRHLESPRASKQALSGPWRERRRASRPCQRRQAPPPNLDSPPGRSS